MPASDVHPDHADLINTPGHRRFTREETKLMEEAGIQDSQYELIAGYRVDKKDPSPEHVHFLDRLFDWLADIYGIDRMRNQMPMEVAEEDQKWYAPKPDIAVLRENNPEYAKRHPRGDEMIMCVEVADLHPQFDLQMKGPLYARAGVPEYWVVDFLNRMVVIQTRPYQGAYDRRTQLLDPLSVSVGDASIQISSLLPVRE